jgi:hypothetical protein
MKPGSNNDAMPLLSYFGYVGASLVGYALLVIATCVSGWISIDAESLAYVLVGGTTVAISAVPVLPLLWRASTPLRRTRSFLLKAFLLALGQGLLVFVPSLLMARVVLGGVFGLNTEGSLLGLTLWAATTGILSFAVSFFVGRWWLLSKVRPIAKQGATHVS